MKYLSSSLVLFGTYLMGTLPLETYSRPSLASQARTFSRPLVTMKDLEIDLYGNLITDTNGQQRRRLQSNNGHPTLMNVVSVTDFGAVGDGITDNTQAFQAAMNSLATSNTSGGGTVYVPSGLFAFDGSLIFPNSVNLVGTFLVVPSHNVGQTGGGIPTNGSILMPRGNRNNPNGTAFLVMTVDCTVHGFTIYYPDQVPDQAPVPYPWTISMTGNNIAVTDVELLNSWNGILAEQAHRHYIARIQGQPINIGISIADIYDIGRVENVHWNPWYSSNANYILHQTTQGIGFLIARTDWEYVLNTFVFSMSIGYRFVADVNGACNGNFVGIGADCCANASVMVDAADPWGISIINGEFTSFSGGFGPDIADHTQVVVSDSNAGAVRFVNSAFWGPSNQIAKISGTGSVGFESCMFNTWDAKNLGRAAIQSVGAGDLLVRGCDFQSSHPGGQVYLGPGSGKAIVTENLIKGVQNITDGGAKLSIIKDNAPDST